MNRQEMPRVILIGSVNSSLITLKKMVAHQCKLVAVFGIHPEKGRTISGYQDLVCAATELGVQGTHYFSRINDEKYIEQIKALKPDWLFVIGLSQMIGRTLLKVARLGNIGFHPTLLPKGRGRGAIAWIVLGKAEPAASFFILDEGMDSGPIVGQKAIQNQNEWYAQDVLNALVNATDELLDEMLPAMNRGELEFREQDDAEATYLGQRKPEDGRIDWNQSAQEVQRLIRASSRPLPGAFSQFAGQLVRIWKADVSRMYTGVPGRIIDLDGSDPVVACGKMAIRIREFECEEPAHFRVGSDFENVWR